MTEHEKDLILQVVKYHMDHELRREVMTQVPLAYNSWVGAPVVKVSRESDGSRLA